MLSYHREHKEIGSVDEQKTTRDIEAVSPKTQESPAQAMSFQRPDAFGPSRTTVAAPCSQSSMFSQDGTVEVFGIEALVDGTAFNEETTDLQEAHTTPFVCSKSVLEGTVKEKIVQYEGWLIHSAEEPRTVKVPDFNRSPSKRKASDMSEKQDKEILDIVLLDNTGPLMVTLWGDCVTSFFEQKRNLPQGTQANQKSIVHLSALTYGKLPNSEWNGVCLSTIKVMSTMEARSKAAATVVTFMTLPSSPYLTKEKFDIPRPPACVALFSPCKNKMKAPFRGTFCGTVANTQDMEETVRGKQKLYFDLVDSSGTWFLCCAMGMHARNKSLKDGAQVVLFFGTARGSLHDSPAALYLFQDAVIIQFGKVANAVPKRMKLEIE